MTKLYAIFFVFRSTDLLIMTLRIANRLRNKVNIHLGRTHMTTYDVTETYKDSLLFTLTIEYVYII